MEEAASQWAEDSEYIAESEETEKVEEIGSIRRRMVIWVPCNNAWLITNFKEIYNTGTRGRKNRNFLHW